MLFTMGNVGLPGTSGFVGEILTMVGAYKASTWTAIVAATGVILSAVYALTVYRRVVFGEITNPALAAITDLDEPRGADLRAADRRHAGAGPAPDLVFQRDQRLDRATWRPPSSVGDGRAGAMNLSLDAMLALPELILAGSALVLLVWGAFAQAAPAPVFNHAAVLALIAAAVAAAIGPLGPRVRRRPHRRRRPRPSPRW